ncbi:MAG: hypothetical protein NTY22_09340 [Proteobacteria bacterium]|nr:hypothetical protein [Pseudomonadota bacterium]
MRIIAVSIFTFMLSMNTFADFGIKNGELNVVYTNDLEGSVDTCGCATDPGGGSVRQINWYKKNNLSPLNTIYINGGNTLFTSTDYMDYEVKYLKYGAQVIADSMSMMNIDAYTPGEKDFEMGLDFFISVSKKLPVLITNSDSGKFKKDIIVNKGGYKIGILGVISEKSLSKELVSALSIKDSISSLKNAVSKLKKDVDIIILIAHTGNTEFKTIIKNSKDIDIVLSTGVNEELTRPLIENNSIFIRMLPGGDSIGLLKYMHKKNAKKTDLELDNKIDFLGKIYDGKNALSTKVKKYEALSKTSAPQI